MKKIYTFLLGVFMLGQIHGQGGDIFIKSADIHIKGIICLSGDFIDESDGKLSLDGELCFFNSTENEVSFSLDSELQEALINFKGNAESTLYANGARIRDLQLDIPGADLYLNGELQIDGSLSLFNGRIFTDENNPIYLSNPSESAIIFNNAIDNTSFIIGQLKRKVSPESIYDFPLGNETTFHPIRLSAFEGDGVAQVTYNSDIEAEWRTSYPDSKFVFPTGGWILETEGLSYQPDLSLADKNGELLDQKYAILYSNDYPFFQTEPFIDRNASLKEEFYLESKEQLSSGMLTVVESNFGYLSKENDIELVNTIVVKDNAESHFIIPGLEDFQFIKLKVYNSLGGLIFSSDNYMNNLDFRKYNDGTYYYYLNALTKDGNSIKKSELIEVVRSNE